MRSVLAVTDASARTRGEPSGGGPEEGCRSCREGENDSTLARARDILFRAGGHLVDAPFRLGLRKTSIGGS
jgi:hypothetical protein